MSTESRPRRILVLLVDRANYGRLKPVMAEIQRHAALELQVLATGTMVLERFGQPANQVRADGFPVSGQSFIELEGSNPTTMAKSLGLAVVEFASEFQRLAPDLILLIGDRYEALAGALAAAFTNRCVVHMQGGEVSGSIDESTRHAITKFAHYHVPATERARDFLLRMGERPETVLAVGCPSGDLARSIDDRLDGEVINSAGNGATIDVESPFRVAAYHPTTTEFGHETAEIEAVLRSLADQPMPTVLLWPNIDAGADHISKAIRRFRNRAGRDWLRTITNLDPENYLRVLRRAACCVGNSSSFVRDTSFFGTPVVLAGDRQRHREVAENVVRVPVHAAAISDAIGRQIAHGPYPPSVLYGDGRVAERAVAALAALEPYVQKHLAYVDEAGP